MTPTRIDGAREKPLGAPADWNPDQNGHCNALFVRDEEIEGAYFMRSAWEASPSEALSLLAGAKVELGVCGRAHPVVQLGVKMPEHETNPAMAIRFLTDPKGVDYIRVDAIFPTVPPASFYASIPRAARETVAEAVAAAVDAIEALAAQNGVTL